MDKIDVLLINSPSPNPGSILSHRLQGLTPLGIGYIATYLNKNGFKTEIIDFYIKSVTLKNFKKILEEKKPKIVGISTTTETYKNGLRLANLIKEMNSNITIVMGGAHVTFEYEDALQNKCVDFVIRGEGEITFKELADYIINKKIELKNIDGISYVENEKVVSNKNRALIQNLDEMPFPDRNLYDLDKYSYPASISTSRGCPGQCIFCAAGALSGGKYRIRSAENVVAEMEMLYKMGFKHIQVIDDTMTANIRRLREIVNLLIKKKMNITWSAESRVDIINKPLLEKMYESGCRKLQFGVEAGNQEMLDCLKKNITLTQIKNVFKWCKEVGIQTASCLIIGQPFDTIDTINQTIDIGIELQNLGAQIVFSISTPYPGTYMYNNKEELGIQITDSDFDHYTTQSPVYSTKHLTSTQIQNCFFDACTKLAIRNNNVKLKAKYKEIFEEVKNVTNSVVDSKVVPA